MSDKSYKNKCPFNHKYHTDVDKTCDCEFCELWEKCINNKRDKDEVVIKPIIK